MEPMCRIQNMIANTLNTLLLKINNWEMPLRKIAFILFLLPATGNCQIIRYRMIHMQRPAVGQYMLHILPWYYDSTKKDEQIARCLDTLPGHLFSAKMYNMLYRDDTTKLAVKADEGVYLFHKRYTINIYWKNGNKKSVSFVNRHFVKYLEHSFYDNDAPMAFGRYRKGNKKGRWVYYNTQGKKVKVERYSRSGTLKKSKTFDPPIKTLRTVFNPRHLSGTPYIIR